MNESCTPGIRSHASVSSFLICLIVVTPIDSCPCIWVFMQPFERYVPEPGIISLCIRALTWSITNSAGRFCLATSLRKGIRISRSFLSGATGNCLGPLKLQSFPDQRSRVQYQVSTMAVSSNPTCVSARRPPSTMISSRTVTYVTRS